MSLGFAGVAVAGYFFVPSANVNVGIVPVDSTPPTASISVEGSSRATSQKELKTPVEGKGVAWIAYRNGHYDLALTRDSERIGIQSRCPISHG